MGNVFVGEASLRTTPVGEASRDLRLPPGRGTTPRGTGPKWFPQTAILVIAVVGLGTLSLGLTSDLHTRSELRQARSSLRVTRSQLVGTLRALTVVESTEIKTASQRDVLQTQLTTTSQELGTAEASLSSTRAGLSSAQNSLAVQGVNIAVLNTCLSGVEQALNQIAVGDSTGAVTSISAVSSSCQSLQGQGKGGPGLPF